MIPYTMMSAVVPSLLLIYYVTKRDLYPEPTHLIWKTFALGCATIPFIVVLETKLQRNFVVGATTPTEMALLMAFLVAGFSEELFKFLVLWFYCRKKREFDEPMDGIVYGVVVSMGFATLENITYVYGHEQSMHVAMLRAVTAVPAHAFFGVFMGYLVGRAWAKPESRTKLLLGAFLVPVFFHGLYDYLLMYPMFCVQLGYDVSATPWTFGAIVLVPFMGAISYILIAKMRREQELTLSRPVPPPPWTGVEITAITTQAVSDAPQGASSAPPMAPQVATTASPPPFTPPKERSEDSGSTFSAIVRILFGFILATLGGLGSLGGALQLYSGETEDMGGFLVAWAIMAALLYFGAKMFRKGVKMLND